MNMCYVHAYVQYIGTAESRLKKKCSPLRLWGFSFVCVYLLSIWFKSRRGKMVKRKAKQKWSKMKHIVTIFRVNKIKNEWNLLDVSVNGHKWFLTMCK